MYHLRVPQTEEELERYYQFRWEMLRKPLHQPKGSERDAWDAMAHHQMVVDEEGNLVAVGRLYINADNEASIRFMAVDPSVQEKGLGTLMAMTLESVARQEGVKRVTRASVTVEGDVTGEIGPGLLVLLGVERDDDEQKANRLCERVLGYRIFSDAEGKMNLNVQQSGGSVLVVSQFTLAADTERGMRPGFSKGAAPERAEAL